MSVNKNLTEAIAGIRRLSEIAVRLRKQADMLSRNDPGVSEAPMFDALSDQMADNKDTVISITISELGIFHVSEVQRARHIIYGEGATLGNAFANYLAKKTELDIESRRRAAGSWLE